jgi:hypothetical protein
MGLILCALGFVSVAFLSRRSLGDGLGLLLAIGSVYGIARCNIFDGFTHFLFDASVLGAYVGGAHHLLHRDRPDLLRLSAWIIALACLPVLLILASPFFDAQPVLVQLLGLRPAIYFVPLALLGATLGEESAERLACWAVFVSLGTGAIALAEYFWGLEPFFPVNDASDIIYLSQDIGEARNFRLPSTFSSAHAYGGTMVAIFPLLVYLIERRSRWRAVASVALVVAALGVFACGARSPVLVLGALALGLAVHGVKNGSARSALAIVGAAVLVVVPRVERFQRFETLTDVSYTRARIAGSVNTTFVDTIASDPFGRGLGSALGTSVPYFLADQARPQVGMENEYVRIAVEEGLPGLVLWVAFVGFVLVRNPLDLRRLGPAADLGLWLVCLASWIQGFIGVGMLASVPGTMLLMVYMGLLATGRKVSVAEEEPGGVPFASAFRP